jgi:putative ABC transport system substrate-binding protein
MLLAAGLLAARRVSAQAGAPTGKIGYLHPRTAAHNSPTVVALRPAWEKLGYREPGSVLLRSGEGDPARLPGLAAELVSLGAGVLIAVGPAAVKAATQAVSIPVVAIDQESDPIRSGLISSFGRPGGNVTGLFVDQPALAGKMTDLLKEAAPTIRRVAIVATADTTPDQLDAALGAARARGLEAVTVTTSGPESYDAAFASLAGNLPTGIVQLGTPGFILDAASFASAAQKHGLPNIAFLKVYTRDGVLMTYGPSQERYFPRAVTLADRILKGERAADLPIDQPTEFELAINLKAARALRLDLPPTLLARADEVIE